MVSSKADTQNFPTLVILVFLGLVIVTGVLYALFQPNSIPSTETPSASLPTVNESSLSADIDVIEPPADWQTYSGDEYTFNYPSGIVIDTEAAGAGSENIRVRFMGPKQIASGRTQTSLFDGYIFIISKVSGDDRRAEAWAKERMDNFRDSCGPDVQISEMEAVRLGDVSGVSYTVRNCMADHTNNFVSANGSIYEVTQIYVGDLLDQMVYEQITDQIFSTLRFQQLN